MTTAETASGLLIDAAGEALCESCLAFACSASLAEIRSVIEDLLRSPNFQRRDRCELSSHRAGNHLRCEVRTLQSCCTAGGRCPGRRRRYLPRHVLPDAVLGQEHPDFEKIRPGVAPTHQRCAPSDTREPFFRR
jgi:hypothetical protein